MRDADVVIGQQRNPVILPSPDKWTS